LKARYTQETVDRARRRPGNHNQRRSAVGRELANRLANEYYERFRARGRRRSERRGELADLIRATPQFKWAARAHLAATLGTRTPADLFAPRPCCARPVRDFVSDEELALVVPGALGPRSTKVKWTKADAALIDEARVLLGPLRRPRPVVKPGDNGILDGIDLDAYAGDVRAAALRVRPNATPRF